MCVGHVGARKYYPRDADSKLAVVWLILVQPFLFGAIGIEIDFRLIQGSLIWKTVIILALGRLLLPAPFICFWCFCSACATCMLKMLYFVCSSVCLDSTL